MAPMKRSRVATSRLTMAAVRSPPISSACMRALEAAVSAVSAPEKKADSARLKTTTAAAAHRLTETASSIPLECMASRSCQFVLEKGLDIGRLDILRDEALAD